MLCCGYAGVSVAILIALVCVCSISDVFLLVTKSTMMRLGERMFL
jgi:hypothetical protein